MSIVYVVEARRNTLTTEWHEVSRHDEPQRDIHDLNARLGWGKYRVRIIDTESDTP